MNFIDIVFIGLIILAGKLAFNAKAVKAFSTIFIIAIGLLLSLMIAPYITDLIGSNYKMDKTLLFFIGLVFSFGLGILAIKRVMEMSDQKLKSSNMGYLPNVLIGFVLTLVLMCGFGNGLEVAIDSKMVNKRGSVTYDFVDGMKDNKAFQGTGKMVEGLLDDVLESLEDNRKRSRRPEKLKY